MTTGGIPVTGRRPLHLTVHLVGAASGVLPLSEQGHPVIFQAGASEPGRDPVAAGTPEHVADVIEHWHRVGAADGFTLMPDVIADGLPAFVDQVLPILRRRGL
ncbi:hypothetical protein [Candidatus Frankia alpina]|uniref:hypothetical protein n=1 Tax=Candidatus Frankia alpina TaxID=2699483 RepID=UPI0013D36A3F|nr:hypothetical protein [Candidatus Frankia alpina]